MGIIVSVENPKGGARKSTTVSNIARGLQLIGHTVLIVDRDPKQGTIRKWREDSGREDYPMVVAIDKPTLHTDLSKIRDAFDFVIVDGASKMEDMAASSVRAADIVIIPLQPSGADVDGCRSLVSLIKARQTVTDGLPRAVFLIAGEKKGTRLARGIESALEQLEIPVLKNRTSDSVTYIECLQQGTTVFDEITPEARERAEEVKNVIAELLEEHINDNQKP